MCPWDENQRRLVRPGSPARHPPLLSRRDVETPE